MRTRYAGVLIALLAMFALGAVASGCGGGDDTSSSATESESSEAAETAATSTEAPPAGGETLTIKMNEYNFIPKDAKAKAGAVTIDAENVGQLTHELVLAKSSLDPAKLPTASNGEVDEDALDVVGEAPDVAAGDTGSFSADLESGDYVMICNLPGHYAAGMYGTLTVK